ncbi:MAG TPA: hypothetical protein VLS28_02145 [Candidatus Sulfomarinibacteraceae bacterium]|nr:hypothetical protein [Candidatus Sulfomarinibacteraceae bacterium]
MPAFVALIVIVGVTTPLASWLGRHERVDLSPAPWDLADVARRTIPLISGQAAISVTAIVLLVTLVRNQSTVDPQAFDTVLTMFLVAFLSFVGLAIQLIFLPIEGGSEGALLPRLLATVAGLQHYRTLFLAWLALKPLMDTFGLTGPANLLAWLLGAAALCGWLIVSSICVRIGMLRSREAFALPVIGICLAMLSSVFVPGLGAGGSGAENLLALTLVVFVLNATALGIQALVPILHRSGRGLLIIEPVGRAYILVDLQATAVGIALLWRALIQPY